MSLLQGIESMASNGDLQRLAQGLGHFEQSNPKDQQHVSNMASHADPGMLQQIMSGVARQMDSSQYATHITPGAGGTNPLGSIGKEALVMIGSMLINHLMHGGGYSESSLLSKIPGLHTTNPQQMDPHQVAAVAHYTQQNHPDLFGKVAAAVAQKDPNLLQQFLGSGGMAAAAKALASHFMSQKNA